MFSILFALLLGISPAQGLKPVAEAPAGLQPLLKLAAPNLLTVRGANGVMTGIYGRSVVFVSARHILDLLPEYEGREQPPMMGFLKWKLEIPQSPQSPVEVILLPGMSPHERVNSLMKPRNDFFVAQVISSQVRPRSGLKLSDARVGERVVLTGLLSGGQVYGEALIVDDKRAKNLLLNSDGKSDRVVLYDSEAEFVAVGVGGAAGISGSPVFGADGRFLGHLVRGGTSQGFAYIRVVRASYVRAQLSSTYDRVTDPDLKFHLGNFLRATGLLR